MRNETIDVARGVGILLVVLGHNWIVTHESSELGRIVYSFHVALFFFISGVFLDPAMTIGRTALRKFNTLLKPYFVVLIVLAMGEAVSVRGLPLDNLWGILFGTGQSILWVPLWFLPHLFIATLFSHLVVTVLGDSVDKVPVAAVTLVAMLALGIASLQTLGCVDRWTLEIAAGNTRQLIGLPWSADLTLLSSTYLLAGYMVSSRVKVFRINRLAFIVSVLIFGLCHRFFDETMNLNYRVYGNPLISTLQACTGIYIVLAVSALLAKQALLRNALAYMGSGSLVILIFHGALQGKVTAKAHAIFPAELWAGAAVALPIAIVLSLLIWEIVKRIPAASFLLLARR